MPNRIPKSGEQNSKPGEFPTNARRAGPPRPNSLGEAGWSSRRIPLRPGPEGRGMRGVRSDEKEAS